VKNDIIEQLALQDPLEVRGSFFRPNLHLFAVKKGTGDGVRDMILRLVRARRGESGIVYCLSRKAAADARRIPRRARGRAEEARAIRRFLPRGNQPAALSGARLARAGCIFR